MELVLMRHGQAEESNSLRYPDDDLRPLTERGSALQEKVARALRLMGKVPERIISSSRLRARQTAEISAAILRCSVEFNDCLGEHYSPNSVIALLANCPPRKTIMLVSHEPNISDLTTRLLVSDAYLNIQFRRGAVLGLYFRQMPDFGAGSLGFFYQPEDLATLLGN